MKKSLVYAFAFICCVGFLLPLRAQNIDAKLGGSSADECFYIINADGDTLLTVRGDAKVGIGTTAPTERLDVVGNARIDGDLIVTGGIDPRWVRFTPQTGAPTWEGMVYYNGGDDELYVYDGSTWQPLIGGGISQINAGTGIIVTNPTGPTSTVTADIGISANQVAAGNHNHDAAYVNEGQTNSITSAMIVDGTIQQVDLSFAAGGGALVYTGHADIGNHSTVDVRERVYLHFDADPSSVKLYIWGEQFSPLFYTELGQHNHSPGDIYIRHEHAVLASENSETGRSVPLSNSGGAWSVNRITDQGTPIGGATGNTDPVGVYGGSLSTSVKDYFPTNVLGAYIDGTSLIGNYGNGATFSTGAIDLTTVIDWWTGPGTEEHYIEFRCEATGGGRVRYNVYVTP